MSGRVATEAILFDFDGVVASVDLDAVFSLARSYEPHFLVPPPRLIAEHFYDNPRNPELDLGLTTVEAVREAMRPALWRGPREEWLAWWQAVEDAYAVPPGMAELLSWLRGRYRLGMLTDNHLGFRRWLQDRPDIGGYFDVVVCSAEEGLKKPEESLFLRAVERLGATLATTVYVDNDPRNVYAARRLGLRSVHFRSVEQAREELGALLQDHGGRELSCTR
ncbi:MAG TPA: HAD family phosphatase [Longimicrobiaceae bacterium]|nr:HAD family phosphatase [Longimicrobiaceae bacterium]